MVLSVSRIRQPIGPCDAGRGQVVQKLEDFGVMVGPRFEDRFDSREVLLQRGSRTIFIGILALR